MEGHLACSAMKYFKSHLYDCGLKQTIYYDFSHSFTHSFSSL